MTCGPQTDSGRTALLASLPPDLSEFGKQLIASDPAATTLAVAIAAGHVQGSSAPRDALINARDSASIPELEGMLDSLDGDVLRLLGGGSADGDSGAKRRGRPSIKGMKSRSVDLGSRRMSADNLPNMRLPYGSSPGSMERSSESTMAVRRASADSHQAHHELGLPSQLYMQSQAAMPYEPSSYYAPMNHSSEGYSLTPGVAPQPGSLSSSLRTSLDKSRPSYPLSSGPMSFFGNQTALPATVNSSPSSSSSNGSGQQTKAGERRYPIYYY